MMYRYGPSEFYATGPLKHWDGSKAAHKISVETLLINGRYDEVSDLSVQPWFDEILKVKWHVMENSSHIPHWEERERYMQVLGAFLGAKEV
jgi:pimeloyl-ACP methyl ester carboxylesterase